MHPVKSIVGAFKTARKAILTSVKNIGESFKQGCANVRAAGDKIKEFSKANGGGLKGGVMALAAAGGVAFNRIKDKISQRKNETEEERQARKEKSKESLGKVAGVFKGFGKILLGISKMVMTAVMSMAAVKTLMTSLKNAFQKGMKSLEPAVNKIVKK